MKNLIIPTTVVDGFFDDPDAVREFALAQDFAPDPNSMYPGDRSKPLHELNHDLFCYIHAKFLNMFYPDVNNQYSYMANTFFQIVDSKYNTGWVHHDPDLITILIYLNKNPNKEAGTVIYSPKKQEYSTIHTSHKHALLGGAMDEEEGAQYRTENNERFEEEIVVKNNYNRLLAFDSHLFHGVKDFTNDEPRLTLVSFITNLQVKNYPIHTMHRTKLT